MNRLYREINDKISTLNFAELYPGFSKAKFALYDKDSVIFEDKIIPYDEKFMGNTAIEYNGEVIAIWNLDYMIKDIDIFTSKIVHEMFHVFQSHQKETRFPNEMKGIFYNYDLENIIWKVKETRLLIDAYNNSSCEKLNQFLSSRKMRLLKYPVEVNYESGIETVEGMAKYIEIKCLEQLNENKMKNDIVSLIDYISNPVNYLTIRRVSYDIGALLMITLQKMNLPIRYKIKDESLNVDEWYKHEQKNVESIINEMKVNDEELTERQTSSQNDVKEFLNQKYSKVIIDGIRGFDPMNTVRFKEYLIFKNIVLYEKNNENIKVEGMTLGLFDDDNNITSLLIKV